MEFEFTDNKLAHRLWDHKGVTIPNISNKKNTLFHFKELSNNDTDESSIIWYSENIYPERNSPSDWHRKKSIQKIGKTIDCWVNKNIHDKLFFELKWDKGKIENIKTL